MVDCLLAYLLRSALRRQNEKLSQLIPLCACAYCDSQVAPADVCGAMWLRATRCHCKQSLFHRKRYLYNRDTLAKSCATRPKVRFRLVARPESQPFYQPMPKIIRSPSRIAFAPRCPSRKGTTRYGPDCQSRMCTTGCLQDRADDVAALCHALVVQAALDATRMAQSQVRDRVQDRGEMSQVLLHSE